MDPCSSNPCCLGSTVLANTTVPSLTVLPSGSVQLTLSLEPRSKLGFHEPGKIICRKIENLSIFMVDCTNSDSDLF